MTIKFFSMDIADIAFLWLHSSHAECHYNVINIEEAEN
jgi:hypothetical protein